jgi:hypothetical protein
MLPGKAGEGATVDPERGGGGDDAAGDRAQNSGPAAIPQQGTFADDRAWAESADVNPDAEHTVEKKVDVVTGWPCSVSSAPLAILPIAGLLPPRMTRHPGFSGSSMAGSYAWRGTTLSVSTTPRPHGARKEARWASDKPSDNTPKLRQTPSDLARQGRCPEVP